MEEPSSAWPTSVWLQFKLPSTGGGSMNKMRLVSESEHQVRTDPSPPLPPIRDPLELVRIQPIFSTLERKDASTPRAECGTSGTIPMISCVCRWIRVQKHRRTQADVERSPTTDRTRPFRVTPLPSTNMGNHHGTTVTKRASSHERTRFLHQMRVSWRKEVMTESKHSAPIKSWGSLFDGVRNPTPESVQINRPRLHPQNIYQQAQLHEKQLASRGRVLAPRRLYHARLQCQFPGGRWEMG